MWLEILLLLVAICYGLHTWALSYWKRKGILQIDGSFIFGNIKDILFMKTTLTNFVLDIYEKHKQEKLVGIYSFYKPFLVVTEPDLIRQIIVKDFANFSGAPIQVDMKLDPVFAVNPFAAPDMETWKETRGLHVPLVTPSKLKSLPELMVKIGHSMINFIKESKSGVVKVKDLSDLLTIDTVASFSYGSEPTAFSDPENPFRKYGRDLFTNESSFTFNGYLLFPKLVKILSYRMITKESEEFFISFCKKMMEFRRRNPSDRPDFFEHMEKVNKKRKEEGKKIITDEEIGFHAMTTYLDAFFTTGASFGYFLVELAKHPDVQEKIRRDILAVGNKMEDFDYDKVNSLSLLQMALSESLRLHTPVGMTSRTCTKTCELAGKKIDAGTRIFLPYLALHLDSQYYPEPMEFKPERYLSEDSHSKGTLLPFGDGPRMCIGHRYAQMVIKVGIVHLLLNFKISPEKKDAVKSEKETLFPLDVPSENMDIIFEPLIN